MEALMNDFNFHKSFAVTFFDFIISQIPAA